MYRPKRLYKNDLGKYKRQKERFNDFYDSVKHLKLTSAILQHFFFGNMDKDNIIDHIEELEKIVNENQYESKKDLYT